MPSYSEGTLSVDFNDTTVTFVGAAALTAVVKTGDIIHALVSQGGSPEIFADATIGVIDTVATLTCELEAEYLGDDLVAVSYYIVKGIGWLSGAAQVAQFVTLMTELAGQGLAGIVSGVPDNDDGARNNTLLFDWVNGVLYQKIAGSYRAIATGLDFDARGDVTGSPSDRDAYDDEAKDFTFFSVTEGGYYFKLSGTSADWSDLVSLKGAQGLSGSSDVTGTSASSVAIGTGSKSFTVVETARGWAVGARLRASSAAAPGNYMEGVVASYSGTALTLTVDLVGGSGTLADWVFNLAGDRGTAGTIAGSTGATDNHLLRADGTGGATAQSSAIAVDDSGNITAFGGQIAFPATQSASAGANTLDDYEEGTWTPTISFGGNSVGATYSSQAGAYVKVGKMVVVTFTVVMTAKGSSTGQAALAGLPFAVSAGGGAPSFGYVGGLTSVTGMLIGSASGTFFNFRQWTGSLGALTDANFTDAAAFAGTLVYST